MEYTLAKFSRDVLLKIQRPLTYQEIWHEGTKLGLTSKFRRKLLDPVNALGAQLYRETKINEYTLFRRIGTNPVRFYLKELKYETEVIPLDSNNDKKSTYHERALHPLLAYYVFSNPVFNRGRNVYTKTIYHEKAKKNGYNQWNFPDMVGVYMPINDWSGEMIEFNRITDGNAIRIYSFEIKKKIDRNNYRESFFQAVSNSSWANEAYLVTADINEDDDLLTELYRLSSSFGVGILKLNVKDIDSSTVLFQSKPKENLDWLFVNKLMDSSECFRKFISNITIEYKELAIDKSEYDVVIDDPIEYVKNNL
ncbi:MAG: hypothetical protein WC069_06670 [Candidatus Shapirobacteria bacterium]